MVRSMTGYGRAREMRGGRDITVEVRSVNNRYLDCTVKMPRAYIFAEDAIKTRVQKAVSRGKVDVPVWYWQGHVIWGMTARIVRDLAQTAP